MKRLTPLWLFVILAVACVVYLPSFSKYMKLKRREEKLVEDIQKLQKQIDSLKQEEHLLKTNVARLEEVVREELGLVKPGEIVYKVIEESPAKNQTSNTVAGSTHAIKVKT